MYKTVWPARLEHPHYTLNTVLALAGPVYATYTLCTTHNVVGTAALQDTKTLALAALGLTTLGLYCRQMQKTLLGELTSGESDQ